MFIDSVTVHEKFNSILVVKSMDGAIRHFLMYQGTFIPGRVVQTYTAEYTVHFFLPFMDGIPTVLEVEPR